LILIVVAMTLVGITAETYAEDASTSQPGTGELTISTDRPSFSDGTGIVPVGRLQVETGYTFTLNDDDGTEVRRHNGPDTIARVGLLDDRLEVRALWSGWNWAEVDSAGENDDSEGASDLILGAKLKLFDQADWIPRLALVAQTSIGAGSQAFSSQEVDPVVKLAWSYALPKGFGVGGNFNVAFPSDDDGHFTQGQFSVYATWAATSKTSFFAEYYVLTPLSRDGGPAHSVDFGVLYLLTKRVQLDGRVGCGLNERADDFFAGVGISFLF